MNRFRSFHRRWRLEVAIVLIPLLAIIVLQYVSSRRLARIDVIAHQSTLLNYLDAVSADVRRVYEDAAEEVLAVPADALAAQRFDAIARHFDTVDASAARVLFAGSLDGCSCLTHYYDPATGHIGLDADHATKVVALRVNTLLRLRRMQNLRGSEIYVDELDAENRVLYRFVAEDDSDNVGFVGLVVDKSRFEREYLPKAIVGAADMLAEDVWDNLIVRVTDGAGRVVAASHDERGQDDAVTDRFDFVFRDLELSAQSRHIAAALVLQSNALTSWTMSVLMAVMASGGVLLTWRAARRERQLSQIRSGFVANVSHELRTPLSSIAVFGELLRRGRVSAPDKVVEYGRRIEQEGTRLGHLIDNVLSFGCIEAAEVRYRPTRTCLEDVVGDAVAAVDSRRTQGGFTITVTRPDPRLPEVCIDAPAMIQVFVNLLDNAMKYSGSCRRVRLELRLCNDEVAVDVADGGIGIAPDDQHRIFDEFYRSDTRDISVTGAGLGLAIARHVVHAHGGRIRVRSRLGGGATFTVLLPAVTAVVRQRVDEGSTLDRSQLEARA